MDNIKKRLKTLCRPGLHVRPEFAWPLGGEEPYMVVKETMELMRYHRDMMRANWETMAVEKIQSRWCCGEYPYLFRERWEAHFSDWCDIGEEKFDPSRASELYDSLKYDALHKSVHLYPLAIMQLIRCDSRVFLETIFGKPTASRPSSIDSRSTDSGNEPAGAPRKLRELYRRAKLLFDLSQFAFPSARAFLTFRDSRTAGVRNRTIGEVGRGTVDVVTAPGAGHYEFTSGEGECAWIG